MKKLPEYPSKTSEPILYQDEDGQTRIEVRLTEDTVWLSQKLISELFQKDLRTINEHIQNIFEGSELEPGATIRKFRIVQAEGKRQYSRLVDFSNSGSEVRKLLRLQIKGPIKGVFWVLEEHFQA
jgi:hypothetical protein